MSKEAMQLALEALEDASAEMLMETGDKNYYIEAIAVLRQALVDADDTSQERVDEIVKDEHEPVAWRSTSPDGKLSNKFACKPTEGNWVEPLYTAPPKQWVGLTDEEVKNIVREAAKGSATKRDGSTSHRIAQAIEAKLKEKNNG